MRDIQIGSLRVGNDSPFLLIAGPCIAESQGLCEQVCGTLQTICQKEGFSYVFKGSYDKANRMSGKSSRGPGLAKGLKILAAIKKQFGVPVLTDIHHPEEAKEAAEVADVIQIPALLIRQTDLVLAAAKTRKTINLKKGQFMAPDDMRYIAEKVSDAGNKNILLTERGTTFGYHQLVADFRSVRIMSSFGYPVIFDASHSAQQPGAGKGKSGGNRDDVLLLAQAAAATGIHGLFLEVHPHPDQALSDAATQINLTTAKILLETVARIRTAIQTVA